METATYLEQTYDLIRYVVRQMGFPDISHYYSYMIAVGFIFLILIIVLNVIKRKRAVCEYLEDGVCLKVEFASMGDKMGKLREVLQRLHEKLLELYKNKYYFAVELMLKEGQDHFFLFLPRIIYKDLTELIGDDMDLQDVTSEREKFVDGLVRGVAGLELELSSDFVFPLILPLEKKQHVDKELASNEWVFLQILLRPVGHRWLTVLDHYIAKLKQGKDPSSGYSGCSGGCLSVTLPFFSFIGDVGTSLIHGSKGGDKKAVSELTDEALQRRLDIVGKKRDGLGFEVMLRAAVQTDDEERKYLLLDKLLDLVASENEEGNSFVISKLYDRLGGSFRNDLFFANMGRSVVDVLTVQEILNLIGQFV